MWIPVLHTILPPWLVLIRYAFADYSPFLPIMMFRRLGWWKSRKQLTRDINFNLVLTVVISLVHFNPLSHNTRPTRDTFAIGKHCARYIELIRSYRRSILIKYEIQLSSKLLPMIRLLIPSQTRSNSRCPVFFSESRPCRRLMHPYIIPHPQLDCGGSSSSYWCSLSFIACISSYSCPTCWSVSC